MIHVGLTVFKVYAVVSDRSEFLVELHIVYRITKGLSWDPYKFVVTDPWLTGNVSAEDAASPLRTYACLKE